jgi:hypothetical protein
LCTFFCKSGFSFVCGIEARIYPRTTQVETCSRRPLGGAARRAGN